MLNSEDCLPALFPEHLFIEGDDQHVIQVDALAGMGKNTDEIVEVIGLMKLEKVIGESKGLEGQIGVFLVRIALREIQRVVAHRDAGAGWIKHSQLVQTARCRDLKEQTVKETAIPFPVKDDHRNAMRITHIASH